MVGIAVGDALGAPVEFAPRDKFLLVNEMMAGGYFHLLAGAWIDDTAMAFCLADSLVHNPDFAQKIFTTVSRDGWSIMIIQVLASALGSARIHFLS